MHTFTYQKTLFNTLLLLVFKIAESLLCILKGFRFPENLLQTYGIKNGQNF